jgi:glycerophosphoryl diester phosphodiesterase
VTVLVLLLVRGSIALLVTQAVTALDAILFTGLYARFAGRLPSVHARAPSRGSRLVATALATVAGAGATSSALLLAGTVGPGAAIEVHAHRGSLAHGPENSLPAFEGAIAAGADAVETDVQLTRDGTLILVHDADLRRVAGLSIRAADLTAERLATLRLPGSGERIVTLAELLEVSRGRIRVNIELKRYRDSPPGLVPAVVRAVRSAEMEGEVVVQSFEVSQLRETAEALPGVPVGLLISVPAASPFDVGVDFLSMEQSRIDRGFVQRSHAAGKQVFGWTLRTEPAMRRLVEAGVDGLIAHDVATAIRVRDEWLEANPEERILRQLRAIVVS